MFSFIAFIITDFSNWFWGILTGFSFFPVVEAEIFVPNPKYAEHLEKIALFREFIVKNYRPEDYALLVDCIDQTAEKINAGLVEEKEIQGLITMIEIWTTFELPSNHKEEFIYILMTDPGFRLAMVNYITTDTVFQSMYIRDCINSAILNKTTIDKLLIFPTYPVDALTDRLIDAISMDELIDKIVLKMMDDEAFSDLFVNVLIDRMTDKMLNNDEFIVRVVDKMMSDETIKAKIVDKMVHKLIAVSIQNL